MYIAPLAGNEDPILIYKDTMRFLQTLLGSSAFGYRWPGTRCPSRVDPRPASEVLEKRAKPTVSIASGSIVGTSNSKTENFNGIPLRCRPPGICG